MSGPRLTWKKYDFIFDIFKGTISVIFCINIINSLHYAIEIFFDLLTNTDL